MKFEDYLTNPEQLICEAFSGVYSILPAEMAYGKVIKFPFVNKKRDDVEIGEEFEASLLLLFPGAVIWEHKHVRESEVYLFQDGTESECAPGKSHSLRNESMMCMPIWAIKRKA